METDSGPRTVADKLLPTPPPPLARKSGACYAFSRIPSLIYKIRGVESRISDSSLILCKFMIPGYLFAQLPNHQCLPVQKVSPVHQLGIMLKERYWAHINLLEKGGKWGHKFISCYLATAAHDPLPSPAGETGKVTDDFFFLLMLAVWKENDNSFGDSSCCQHSPLDAHCTYLFPEQDWLSDRDLRTSILILT